MTHTDHYVKITTVSSNTGTAYWLGNSSEKKTFTLKYSMDNWYAGYFPGTTNRIYYEEKIIEYVDKCDIASFDSQITVDDMETSVLLYSAIADIT